MGRGHLHFARNDVFIYALIAAGTHQVFENGEIFSLRNRQGHLTSEWRRCDVLVPQSGYRRVRFGQAGKNLPAHRFVYFWFHRFLDSRMQVNHIDGNKGNNAIANLELVTPAENNLHSFRALGRLPSIGRSKIDLDAAEEVRALAAKGWKYDAIGERFGLCKSTISYIVNRKTWARGA